METESYSKCKLNNTLVVGICEAAEAGIYEACFEVPREEAPDLTDEDVLEVVMRVAHDARIETIQAQCHETCFRFNIRLLADAAQVHNQAVKEGLIEPGLVLERAYERVSRHKLPDWKNLPAHWLN